MLEHTDFFTMNAEVFSLNVTLIFILHLLYGWWYTVDRIIEQVPLKLDAVIYYFLQCRSVPRSTSSLICIPVIHVWDFYNTKHSLFQSINNVIQCH